jgi:predicted lipoprotein with Yx(FWY)xxD motif
MNRHLAMTIGVATVALAAAACSSSSSPAASGAPAATSGSSGAAAGAAGSTGGATLSVASTSFGQILVDGQGRTLYLFAADTGKTSTCDGSCATYWPPDTTTGAAPQAGSGVNAALIGTSKRSDGSTEVTYNGHPLYYFSGDSKTGDTAGQNLDASGAKWYVVNPSGAAVTTAAVASPSASVVSGGGGY